MDYQDALLKQDFGTLDELIFAHAQQRPLHPALICGPEELDYSTLHLKIGRVAASLKRDHVGKGDVVAICASASIAYAQVFLGALRAGAAVAPLAPSSTPDVLAAMLIDSGATIVFMDAASAATLSLARTSRALAKLPIFSIVSLDGSGSGIPLDAWLACEPVESDGIEIRADDPFNIIYSSGTTGTPKGIVQPHGMRWTQFRRLRYAADAVTIISTPLYSNTTLVCFLPTLAAGATAVLMPKFDVPEFLRLSEYHRVTHTMLVPVQYQRLMRDPSFDDYDLSSYRVKFSTSAPFAVELKQEVLARWPGGLIELYGMTEGGGSCMLEAHRYPEKLHTVGKPMDGNDIRVIDERGVECLTGKAGEIVGRSASMMTGYLNLPDKTRETEWVSPDGLRFIRTGDIGRFDADGFLVLIDRAKDLIISGGFNIYPSDLEAVLATHPAVEECAVVGVASAAWGETPVAFARLRDGSDVDAISLKAFVNDRVGRTQRLSDLLLVDTLPRSAIGKILKRDLRQRYEQRSRQTASS
ncbi:class I adenylate-forming enzyme family protein [Paraburkholderia caribensis]|uniref:class I adenylate-forming enzyme family protein n=1 Tax=Paraburkholderia caribensis TaxID=75105 RepID=UPI00078BB295|nr:class I adenylate-forming enzyme family protein [Paraburkholderia caribensis]AMV48375.1 4-coumarate--CoA ligase [Paraburkholderia caribensis]